MFAGIFEKYFDKEDVVEEVTRTLKHFMRSLLNDFDEFLHDYMNLIYSCYQVGRLCARPLRNTRSTRTSTRPR